MANKEKGLDSGLVVVVFIITREGGIYIYIGITMMYNALMLHCKSFDGAIQDGAGGEMLGKYIYIQP